VRGRSTEGAAGNSQGRKPLDADPITMGAPKGRQTLPPLRGLTLGLAHFPGLTPWAIVCRRFAAEARCRRPGRSWVNPKVAVPRPGAVQFGRPLRRGGGPMPSPFPGMDPYLED